MVALGLSLAGLMLAMWIFVRGWHGGLFARYPYFYSYIALHLLCASVLWPVYIFLNDYYITIYWPLELVTRIADYALLVEISRSVFGTYPIIRRVVSAAAIALFVVMFGLYVVPPVLENYAYDVAIHSLGGRVGASVGTLLIILLAMARYYRIPLHNNLKVICAGLGVLTSFRIANYMLAANIGNTYLPALRLVDSVGWVICGATWAVGLRQVTHSLQTSSSRRLDLHLVIGEIRNLNNVLMGLFR